MDKKSDGLMDRINVLQLVTGLGVGGAEKVVLSLSTNLDKNKFKTYIVSLSDKTELLEIFGETNIETISLGKKNSLKDFFQIVSFLHVFLKKKKIHVIHAHLTHAMFVAVFVKFLNPNIRIVFTSHSLNIGSKIREFIAFLFKPFRDIDIVISQEILKYFYKKNYVVIANGVKTEEYQLNVSKNEPFLFLAVGRLEKVKNHKLLIECASVLKDKYNFEIWIAGEGPLKEELEVQILKNKLQMNVKLLGIRSDIPELLNRAHCFVMPSLWEGFPISILEAGSANLPVIATPVGGVTSLLNEKNAFLSTTDQFLDNMEFALNNYTVALSKASHLKELIIRKYSLKSIVDQHQKIYEGLIK